MLRIKILFLFVLISVIPISAQFTYGTTGLLHMPTADMQKDKTFMFGGGYLDKYATPDRWTYDTWNYYINITFFPWLEVAYTCNIFDEYINRGVMVHMINQDRNFSARLRLWKEGWLIKWMPQIVVGGNDVLHSSGKGGDFSSVSGSTSGGNTFFQRYYIAATKHLSWYGEWGLHLSYIYSKRIGHQFNGLAIGLNYQFALSENTSLNRVVNGLNLMCEYDSKYVNIGAQYKFWRERIHIIGELRKCKYPSLGICYKLHLK